MQAVPVPTLPQVRFGTSRVLLVLLLAALIAVQASSAALAADVAVEGESFALPSWAGQVQPDASASGGRALLLWTTSTATAKIATPRTGELLLRVRGDQCQGAPVVALTVDGAAVGSSLVSTSRWTDISFRGSWVAGSHRIDVAYTNDAALSGCDRNLWLDRVTAVASTAPTKVARTFGLSSSSSDRGLTSARDTAALVGRRLDVVNSYEAWVWDRGLPVDHLRAVVAAGARPEITWEPWDPRLGASQSGFSPASIAAGTHDAYVTRWAQAAVAYGQPLLLRFGHEMNGTWYPWAPGSRSTSAADYVAAYRHVHDLFVAAGATNVSWVWSPNTVPGMPTALASVYPGRGYVDLVGVDGYNFGTDVAGSPGWQSPTQVFGATLDQISQVAQGVPVVINETASSEAGGSKAAWITGLVTYLSGTQVTGLYWFDYDSSHTGQTDWRLQSSPTALDAARRALAGW